MTTTIGQPVRIRGKAIIAKKNGASSLSRPVPAGKSVTVAKGKQSKPVSKPVVDKTAALLARIGKEIKAGNFYASIGLNEKTTLYVIALDGRHYVAVTTDGVATAQVGGAYPGSDAGYVEAVHGAADWIAKH